LHSGYNLNAKLTNRLLWWPRRIRNVFTIKAQIYPPQFASLFAPSFDAGRLKSRPNLSTLVTDALSNYMITHCFIESSEFLLRLLGNLRLPRSKHKHSNVIFASSFQGDCDEVVHPRLSKYSKFKCILISRLMDSSRLDNRLELIENRC
jgi:hypothetical protein